VATLSVRKPIENWLPCLPMHRLGKGAALARATGPKIPNQSSWGVRTENIELWIVCPNFYKGPVQYCTDRSSYAA
jgi:hypothetical protein